MMLKRNIKGTKQPDGPTLYIAERPIFRSLKSNK